MRDEAYPAGERLRGGARAGAVLAVALSPYLFGSAEPWAYLTVSLIAGLSVASWLGSLAIGAAPRLRAPYVTLALLALPALLVVQMMPLPASLAEGISPLAAGTREAQVKEFAGTGALDFVPPALKQPASTPAASAAPAATVRSLYLLAAYIGVFLVLANCLTKWEHVRWAATVLAASGFAMALFAVVQSLSGTHRIYWFHAPRFGGSIFGPFTNRNHYAEQMNMLLGVTLGLLLAGGAAEVRGTWRQKLAYLTSGAGARVALLGFGAVLMAASVCLTLSRGGISSLAAALGVVGGLLALRRRTPVRARTLAAVGVLALAVVLWLGWRPMVDRLGTLAAVARDPLRNTRTVGYLDTLRLFAVAPLMGSGFGSFQHAFSIFQDPSIQGERWLHAHNEYAQLLAEGGVLGALLFVVAAGAFLVHVGRRLRDATEQGRLMSLRAGGRRAGRGAAQLRRLRPAPAGQRLPAGGRLRHGGGVRPPRAPQAQGSPPPRAAAADRRAGGAGGDGLADARRSGRAARRAGVPALLPPGRADRAPAGSRRAGGRRAQRRGRGRPGDGTGRAQPGRALDRERRLRALVRPHRAGPDPAAEPGRYLASARPRWPCGRRRRTTRTGCDLPARSAGSGC